MQMCMQLQNYKGSTSPRTFGRGDATVTQHRFCVSEIVRRRSEFGTRYSFRLGAFPVLLETTTDNVIAFSLT